MDFTGNLSRIKITSKILFDLMKYKLSLIFSNVQTHFVSMQSGTQTSVFCLCVLRIHAFIRSMTRKLRCQD